MTFSLSHSYILQKIAEHANTCPEKIAIIKNDEKVTYAQFYDHILEAAYFLRSIGLTKGCRILLSANKEPEFIYLYFAAHILGIVNVIYDPATSLADFTFFLENIKPSLIVGKNKFGLDGLKFIDYSKIVFDDKDISNLPLLTSDDHAEIMFTTGTTSLKKGVCLSYYNISSSTINVNNRINNSKDEVELLALPLSHSFGLGRMRCCLAKGCTLVLVDSFANLRTVFDSIEKHRVTMFGIVPAAWHYMKKLSGDYLSNFASQLRYIEIGSAALSIADKQHLITILPHTHIFMHYGLTEASRCFMMEFKDSSSHLNTIGKPTSTEIDVRIMSPHGTPLEHNCIGEICVKGNVVMSSYLDQEDNERAFWQDYFRTGDEGYLDVDGNYYLVGRTKEIINVGGKKVSPMVVEDCIKGLGVQDCVVIPIPDPKGILGEVPKAYILKAGCNLSFEEIESKLSKLLEPYEIPVIYEWIDMIPKTVSGKVQRLSLIKKKCQS